MSYQSGPSPDDFIIPDEETAPPKSAPATSYTQELQSAPSLFWTPKVDLSLAFTPFVNSSAFSQTNTVRERQYTGGDTLNEPVWHTLRRDLVQIGKRIAIVMWPAQLQKMAKSQLQALVRMAAANGIRLPSLVTDAATPVPLDDDEQPPSAVALDWDLWGPLIFSLAYAVTMGMAAPNSQTNVVFSGTFTFIWLFYLVVGLNIQLLGGSISFLLAISATGYLMFPILVGAIVSTLAIRWRWVRLILISVLDLWSIYAASMSLRCLGVLPGRIFLAIYPVALMYAVISWLVVIT